MSKEKRTGAAEESCHRLELRAELNARIKDCFVMELVRLAVWLLWVIFRRLRDSCFGETLGVRGEKRVRGRRGKVESGSDRGRVSMGVF
ncbi:hypothetical protein M758_UG291000 [Ceratodon purpureus]|nr:hypothetical protein M758_UG291000 [Ceratodon purpureus]KAG0596872.1 hypothetical protein M758_UG291000 [Ceratodon purpureus]